MGGDDQTTTTDCAFDYARADVIIMNELIDCSRGDNGLRTTTTTTPGTRRQKKCSTPPVAPPPPSSSSARVRVYCFYVYIFDRSDDLRGAVIRTKSGSLDGVVAC
jgi:hypothetical protein